MNDASPHVIRSKRGYTIDGPGLCDFEFSTPIEANRYVSREYMQAEWEKVWTKTWVIAGREQQVARNGDYFRFDLGHTSLIVIRGADQKIRAFHNVCRHRGNQIIPMDGKGNARVLVCGYHAWSWNIDGTLRKVRDEDTFHGLPPCAELGLIPVSLDTWGGFIFVNLDPGAKPLIDFLGPIPAKLDRFQPENMKLLQRFEIEVDCNWKTGLDGFTETYHFNVVHPQTAPIVNDLQFKMELYETHNFFEVRFGDPSPRLDINLLTPAMREYMNPSTGAVDGSGKSSETDKGLMDVARLNPEDFEGRASEVRRAVQLKKRAAQDDYPWLPYKQLSDDELTNNYQFLCFPNSHINTFAENMLTFTFWPHAEDPNKCILCLGFYNHVTPEKDTEIPPVVRVKGADPAVGLLLTQDIRIMESLQKGMRSGAVPHLYANEIEGKVAHFHHVLGRYIGH